MIYANNEQLATELKKVLLDKKISQRAISASMGISPQAFQNLLNKKQLSFSDMNKILSTIGYNLLVEYVPADTTQAPEMPRTAANTARAGKSTEEITPDPTRKQATPHTPGNIHYGRYKQFTEWDENKIDWKRLLSDPRYQQEISDTLGGDMLLFLVDKARRQQGGGSV